MILCQYRNSTAALHYSNSGALVLHLLPGDRECPCHDLPAPSRWLLQNTKRSAAFLAVRTSRHFRTFPPTRPQAISKSSDCESLASSCTTALWQPHEHFCRYFACLCHLSWYWHRLIHSIASSPHPFLPSSNPSAIMAAGSSSSSSTSMPASASTTTRASKISHQRRQSSVAPLPIRLTPVTRACNHPRPHLQEHAKSTTPNGRHLAVPKQSHLFANTGHLPQANYQSQPMLAIPRGLLPPSPNLSSLLSPEPLHLLRLSKSTALKQHTLHAPTLAAGPHRLSKDPRFRSQAPSIRTKMAIAHLRPPSPPTSRSSASLAHINLYLRRSAKPTPPSSLNPPRSISATIHISHRPPQPALLPSPRPRLRQEPPRPSPTLPTSASAC
jgi:hypothetical protein